MKSKNLLGFGAAFGIGIAVGYMLFGTAAPPAAAKVVAKPQTTLGIPHAGYSEMHYPNINKFGLAPITQPAYSTNGNVIFVD